MPFASLRVRRLSRQWADSAAVESLADLALQEAAHKLLDAARDEAEDRTEHALRDGMNGPAGSWSQSFFQNITYPGPFTVQGLLTNLAAHALFVEKDTAPHTNGPPPFWKIEEYLSRHGDLTGDPLHDFWLIENVRVKIDAQGTKGKYIMEGTRETIFPAAVDILGEEFARIMF